MTPGGVQLFGSAVLDVAIGLIFLYLILGLICSALGEQVSQFLSLRANHLWDSICNMLGDHPGEGVAKWVYEHGLVKGLAVGQKSEPGAEEHPADAAMPSYIPSSVFAQALQDVWSSMTQEERNASPHLQPLMDSAGRDAAAVKSGIEQWYDFAMARASGWYKRKAQFIVLVIALITVTASNADTLAIANHLWSSPGERTALANAANTAAKGDLASIAAKVPPEAAPLLGWVDCGPEAACTSSEAMNAVPQEPLGWLMKVLGLLMSAFAVSLGAPFWFDLLKKLVTMRAGVENPSKNGKTGNTATA